MDTHLAEGIDTDQVDRWAQSASILHANGDALDIAVKDSWIVGVRGRAEDRVNHGRLGPKDLYGWQANNSPDRLTRPLIRHDGELGLMSTVLQGCYQSHQATAAAVQVDNIHIIRGMLGKPGCGILQMNGQPTAQNTRECGADGDLPAFRNRSNDTHIEDLARVWNIDPMGIPHYAKSDGTPAPAPTTTASGPVGDSLSSTRGDASALADEDLEDLGGVR